MRRQRRLLVGWLLVNSCIARARLLISLIYMLLSQHWHLLYHLGIPRIFFLWKPDPSPQRLRQRRVGSCSRGRVRSSTCPALLAAGTQSRRKSGACSPPPFTTAVKALGGPNPDHPRGPTARLSHAPCHGRRCSFPSSTWSRRPRSRNRSRCYRSACLRVSLRLACRWAC